MLFKESIYRGLSVWKFAGEPGNFAWDHVGDVGVLAEGLQLATRTVRDSNAIICLVVDSKDEEPNILSAVYSPGRGARGKRFTSIRDWNARSRNGGLPYRLWQALEFWFVDPTSNQTDYKGLIDLRAGIGKPSHFFGTQFQKRKGNYDPSDGFWALVLTNHGWKVFEYDGRMSQSHSQAEAATMADNILRMGYPKAADKITSYDRDFGTQSEYPFKASCVVAVRDGSVQVIRVFFQGSRHSYGRTSFFAIPHTPSDNAETRRQNDYRYDTDTRNVFMPAPAQTTDPWRMSNERLTAEIWVAIMQAIDDGVIVHAGNFHPAEVDDTGTGVNHKW